MNAPRRFFCALSLTAALACSSGDSNELDTREAKVGWDTTSRALADARADLDGRIPYRHDGTLRVDCQDGGVLHVVRGRDEQAAYVFDAEFDACGRDGLVIDGALSLVTTVAVDPDDDDVFRDGSAAVLIDYSGHLELRGAIEGECAVDAQLRVGAATIEQHTTIGAKVSGTLCGHDAAEVLRAETQD